MKKGVAKKQVSSELVGEKIKKIMEHYGYVGHASLKRFSEITDISSQNLDAVINGKTKNPTVIIAIKILAAFPDVNAYWLLLDQSNMLKKAVKDTPVDFAPKLEADAVLQKRITDLEEIIKTKDKIINLQEQLLATK